MLVNYFKALAMSALAVAVTAQDDPVESSASRIFKFGCKCGPQDYCWPSTSTWNSFNQTVNGRLIKSEPAAISCYPGPKQDLNKCASLVTDLTNSTFVGAEPIALQYDSNNKCPVVNYAAGETAGTCELGDVPLYTVDATTPAHIQTAVNFARQRGLRIVVRNTGHDLSGRSTGGASLQIWIKNLRQGMTFQQKYTPSQTCNKGVPWTGSAFKVAGGYVWGELYAQAAAKNVVVVGGGDPTVGCIGGWAQGGGHSPANHDFGMGSDQILEAQVVLANGKLVLANACTNSDIFWAIRGGGPGTFGVVVSTTVKAHQTAPYSAHVLALAPTSEAQLAVFQEAVSIIYESMPALADAGWSGYGNWAALNYQPIVANYYSGYNHALAAKGRTIAQMTADFAPIKARLDALVGDNKLFISSQFFTYASYVDYYTAHSGYQQPVGSRGGSSVGSWMLDAPSLSNAQSVRNMINTHTGGQYQFVLNNFWLGGGANSQVKKDGADKFSGLNPAWRDAVALNIVARGWAEGTPVAQQLAIQQDVTNNLIGTMKAMNPDGGAYMNEGDYRSPNHMEEFYGENLDRLKLVKLLRDPLGVFYCQTCVGSESWVVDGGGRLCLDFGFDY